MTITPEKRALLLRKLDSRFWTIAALAHQVGAFYGAAQDPQAEVEREDFGASMSSIVHVAEKLNKVFEAHGARGDDIMDVYITIDDVAEVMRYKLNREGTYRLSDQEILNNLRWHNPIRHPNPTL